MAYSYNDDLEDLSKYITDGLMDVYASGYNTTNMKLLISIQLLKDLIQRMKMQL